jgi:hypothetical protein
MELSLNESRLMDQYDLKDDVDQDETGPSQHDRPDFPRGRLNPSVNEGEQWTKNGKDSKTDLVGLKNLHNDEDVADQAADTNYVKQRHHDSSPFVTKSPAALTAAQKGYLFASV